SVGTAEGLSALEVEDGAVIRALDRASSGIDLAEVGISVRTERLDRLERAVHLEEQDLATVDDESSRLALLELALVAETRRAFTWTCHARSPICLFFFCAPCRERPRRTSSKPSSSRGRCSSKDSLPVEWARLQTQPRLCRRNRLLASK